MNRRPLLSMVLILMVCGFQHIGAMKPTEEVRGGKETKLKELIDERKDIIFRFRECSPCGGRQSPRSLLKRLAKLDVEIDAAKLHVKKLNVELDVEEIE